MSTGAAVVVGVCGGAPAGGALPGRLLSGMAGVLPSPAPRHPANPIPLLPPTPASAAPLPPPFPACPAAWCACRPRACWCAASTGWPPRACGWTLGCAPWPWGCTSRRTPRTRSRRGSRRSWRWWSSPTVGGREAGWAGGWVGGRLGGQEAGWAGGSERDGQLALQCFPSRPLSAAQCTDLPPPSPHASSSPGIPLPSPCSRRDAGADGRRHHLWLRQADCVPEGHALRPAAHVTDLQGVSE